MLRDNLNRRTGLLSFFIIFFIGVFINIVDDVFHDPYEAGDRLFELDHFLLDFISQFRSPYMNQAMTDITALGSVSVMAIMFVVLLIILKIFKDYRGWVYQGIILLGTITVPWGLKLLFMRERPSIVDKLVHVSDTSFPSGHSFTATSIYIALAYYGSRFAKTTLQEFSFYFLGALLIFLVCFSRIYLGVHYPTDVLAGFSTGAIWALSVTLAFELYVPQNAGARSDR